MLGLTRDAILINCDTILAGVNIEYFVQSFYTALSSVSALFFKPANNKATGKSSGAGGASNTHSSSGGNSTTTTTTTNNMKKKPADGKAMGAGMKIAANKHHATTSAINQAQGNAQSSLTPLSMTSLYHAPLHACVHSFTAVGYEERDFAQGDSNMNTNCYSSASGLLSNREAGTRLASPTTLLNTSRSMPSLPCVQPLPHVTSTFTSFPPSLL